MATVDQIPSDLAIEIGQDLPPAEFMSAARHFFGYVDEVARALSPEGEPVRWTVKVREGSAILAAAAPIDAHPDVLAAIYSNVRRAVDAIDAGDIEGAGVSEAALRHLRGLSVMAEGRKGSPVPIRVWVQREPIVIGPNLARAIQEDWRTTYKDYGTVEGRLEAIQDKSGLQISIKDVLFRQAVHCLLPDTLLEDAFSNFRKRVEVSGLIHYRRNGIPMNIEAAKIHRLPDDSELPSAADVRGILAAH